MPRISRRAFLAAAGAGGASVAAYSSLVEARWLDIGRHDIPTGVPGEPVKVLHVADFHASWCVSLDYINEGLRLGLSLKPDLICVTGDFVTSKFDDVEGYARILSQLREAAPVYATFGNHDGGYWAGKHHGYRDTVWARDLLRRGNVPLLHNHAVDIKVKNRTIRLVGLGDLYSAECLPQLAFGRAADPHRPYTIALSHNPDTKQLLRGYPWDLLLCGHTHGGQFYLPLIGAPFSPVIDKRFRAGVYEWEGRRIHITKGIGNMWGLRFNCRPEVSLLTLV